MNSTTHTPSLESLRCFLAGAKHLNFRQAASEVALTPTAFSQRIKQLEGVLGSLLFHRTTRKVTLTRAGLSLVPVALETIQSAHRCVEVVLQGTEPPVHLTLGTRYELGLSWLLPSILRLEDERPTWEINTYFGSGDDILDQLKSGSVDCVVTSAPVARADWEAQVLHPETYALVGSAELLERLPLDRPDEAVHHTLLDTDRSLPLSRYLIGAHNPELPFGQIRFCGTGAAILEMVRAGRGLAVLPEYMITHDLTEGTLRALLPELSVLTDTFRLLYHKDHPLFPMLESLARFLRTQPLLG